MQMKQALEYILLPITSKWYEKLCRGISTESVIVISPKSLMVSQTKFVGWTWRRLLGDHVYMSNGSIKVFDVVSCPYSLLLY